MNTFGHIFRLTTFGESHGPAIGGIIDGIPAGVNLDIDEINKFVALRSPGQSDVSTRRNEPDTPQLLSGISPQGITLGTPIGFTIANTDAHSYDYANIEHKFRPSHADYTYQAKYGVRDHRGGGRSSARETACRMVGGAIAQQILKTAHIDICAYTNSIGSIQFGQGYIKYHKEQIYGSPVRCPEPSAASKMKDLVMQMSAGHNSVGGSVNCIVSGVPAGLGEPIFDKLQAMLASAMMSIPGVKAFEYGMGIEGCRLTGLDMADEMQPGVHEEPEFINNHSGGIQGGISNGEDITMRIWFKPTASIAQPLRTVTDTGLPDTITATGRHDPCIVPRAVPVVSAMASMVMADALLMYRSSRI